MVGWIILAVLVGLITLILLIPIGADIRYEDGVIRISAKAAGIKLQLLPRKKREPKPEKPVEKAFAFFECRGDPGFDKDRPSRIRTIRQEI